MWKNNKKMENLYDAIYRESLITQENQDFLSAVQQFTVNVTSKSLRKFVKKNLSLIVNIELRESAPIYSFYERSYLIVVNDRRTYDNKHD